MNNSTIGRVIDLIILLTFVYFGFYSQTMGDQCDFRNPYCGEDSYCGLDNKCHQFPFNIVVEEEQSFEKENILLIPFLISIAIIGGAYYYKKNDQK